MGSTICTAGFPSRPAIASSCFTARCVSIWYGFFIATLLFLGKRKLLLAYQGFEQGVATFYDLPDNSDPNLLSAMMRSGEGSVLQTTKASSGISVIMPRYSRSSTAF